MRMLDLATILCGFAAHYSFNDGLATNIIGAAYNRAPISEITGVSGPSRRACAFPRTRSCLL